MSVTYLDWQGGQDCVWFCNFVLLSLDVTICVTCGRWCLCRVHLQEGGRSPALLTGDLPGQSWEANSSGTDWERGETFGCMCSG